MDSNFVGAAVVAVLSTLATLGVGFFTLRGTVFASKATAKAQEIVSEKQTASADLQFWTAQVLDRLTAVEDDNEELRARITALEEDLRASRNLFGIAIDYIRNLLYRLSMHGEQLDPPPPLREHLGVQ